MAMGEVQRKNTRSQVSIQDSKERKSHNKKDAKKFPTKYQIKLQEALEQEPDQIVISKYKLCIRTEDVRTLKPRVWLNDNVINFYMELINERSREDPTLPKVYCTSTFFFRNVSGARADLAKRAMRHVDIFGLDMLMVPVLLAGDNHGEDDDHWILLLADLGSESVRSYDSLLERHPRETKTLVKFLERESQNRRGEPLTKFRRISMTNTIPSQKNTYDCGVFVCVFAEYLSRAARLNFKSSSMSLFRKKIAVEIMEGKFLDLQQ